MRKKVSCWAGILLFACALGAQSASGASAGTDVEGFLASLSTGVPVFTSGEGLDSYCSVRLTCDVGGYVVSCQSWSGDCHSNGSSVTCDGATQECPVCSARTTCPCYSNTIECFGWSSCHSGAEYISCDGAWQDCWPPMSQCPV